MVRHAQITQCYTAHKQNLQLKSHDHLDRCRKSSDENQQSFIKSLKKVVTKGIYPNIIQVISDKPRANIILNGENGNYFL
jgi:hypothetical protein